MKLINNFKSPNYNKRLSKKIEYIIIHYTALDNSAKSLKYLCDPLKKVSCHFFITQKGYIYNLVPVKMRAWHAGESFWKGEKDLNSTSIGIELDFSPFHKNNKFNNNMIKSLIDLLIKLKKKYNINKHHILGHSDIAPLRKIDPGPKFPWKKLEKFDLVYLPSIKKNIIKFDIDLWFKNKNLKGKKKIALYMLGYIGYDVSKSIKKLKYFHQTIKSYQRHYYPKNISSKLDHKTFKLLKNHFLSLLLT